MAGRLGRHRQTGRALLGLMLLLGGACAGCGGAVVGRWYMQRAIPNADVFAIQDAAFNRDGTFSARLTLDGRTTDERGTYSFNGYRLTLRPQAGGARSYTAALKGFTLDVIDGERKVILRKKG